MFYRFFQYLKFLFTSTNQYGVHSPFIYEYITKCLYRKPKFKGSKSIRVLLKSIDHFNAKNICVDPNDEQLQNKIKKEFPKIEFDQTPFDIVYVTKPDKNIVNKYEHYIHNNAMVLINSIHSSKECKAIWEQIKILENVTVTIDMYYCGAIFFRREQTKEHFKIRI